MPLGRLGGLLILGSCAFFVLTIIVASTGGSISIGGEGLGTLLATSGFGVFAAGALPESTASLNDLSGVIFA